ncbi:hypothetical protein N9544_03700 [Flavobacteriales bacterium]|nr:hypothetical protein [Flavobacteriales bacterium]
MNLFQKIDNYLLHNFPNIWVTKVHVFLPIAFIFMLIIYTFNVILIGYDVKYPFPQAEWGVTLMIIPVIVFIVYWFVIQARYNVEKSGGKLSIPLEYMNFFLYFLMFGISYLLISFIPYTNDLKIAKTVANTEVSQDIKNLNVGNTIINERELIETRGNRYSIKYNNYIESYYWEENDYSEDVAEATEAASYEETEYAEEDVASEINVTDEAIVETIDDESEYIYEEEYEENYYKNKYIKYEDYIRNPIPKTTYNLHILATKKQVEEIVSDYIYSYNKYTTNEITASAKEIAENELKGELQNYNYNYYQQYNNDDYRYNSWRNEVSYKVGYIARLKIQNNGAFEANYGNGELSKIIVSWLLMLSLMVWIFKQIHWRDYIFGLLALVLTPVLVGILGVFFGIFMGAGEELLFTLLFVAYAVAILFTVKGFASNYKSRFSIVTAMYLHIWLPILPLFYYFFMYEVYYRNNYELRRDYNAETLFYTSIIIGLLSIGLFKLIYKKMRLLPNHK